MSVFSKVEDMQVERGEKNFGFLKVAETPIATIHMPIGVLKGARSGPTLCVTAGVHGCEYPGIEAALRIYHRIDPTELDGEMVIVPVVNMPSFETCTPYFCPIDKVNLNRIFPGDPKGTVSHIIVRTLMEQVILRADYHIDLHGGDLPELLVPYAFFAVVANQDINERSQVMAKIYGTKFIWKSSPSIEGSSAAEVAKRNVPSITAEAGGLGTCNESDVEVHTTGIQNIMKHLKMLKGSLKTLPKQEVFENMFRIRVKRGGIFYPEARPGDNVSNGQILGLVKNLQGENLEEIRAPANGLVYCIEPKRVVNTGERVYGLLS